MSDAECPYCGHEQEINHDDGYGYGESEIYEQQCSNCEKYFAFKISIIFCYSTHKAPCMNGGLHEYKPTMTTPKYWTKMRCIHCDRERELTDGERELHNIPSIPERFCL